MNRRTYLATAGMGTLTVLAGCGSGDESENEDEDEDENGNGDGTDTGDDQMPAGSNVVLVESSETTRTYATGDRLALDFVLENQGGSRSGEVSVTVEWTDDEGNKAGEGFAGVTTLGSGIRWNGVAPIQAQSGGEPSDYEVSVSVEDELEEQPDISVTESSLETMDTDDGEMLVLRGTATNNTGESWDTAVITAQLLDEGTLLQEASESAELIDDGTTWDFEFTFPNQDPDLAGQAESEFYFDVSDF